MTFTVRWWVWYLAILPLMPDLRPLLAGDFIGDSDRYVLPPVGTLSLRLLMAGL